MSLNRFANENKIYLLISGDFVKIGGMDRANYALADYLARKKFEVHLVGYTIHQSLLKYPNLSFHRVPKILSSYLLSEELLDRVGRFWAKRIARKGGRVIVNGGDCIWPDVNWVHYVHAAYKDTQDKNLLLRTKNLLGDKIYLSREYGALSVAKTIICNSDNTRKLLKEKYNLFSEILKVVYLGIDRVQFYPLESSEKDYLRKTLGLPLKSPIVIFVGSLENNRKGLDFLIDAWVKLCNLSEWDAFLVIVGEGRMRESWERYLCKVKINSRVAFLGFRSDLNRLLQASDCFVSPVRYEPYGLAAHEAVCCGVPTIISKDCGFAERLPDKFKELFLSHDNTVAELINLLQKWHSNRDSYRDLAMASSRELCKYTWDDMASKIVAIIEENPK